MNNFIVKMSGHDRAVREIILKIDPTAKVEFGDCKCPGHYLKVRVVLSLDERQDLKVLGFEFPDAGKLGDEDAFDVNKP